MIITTPTHIARVKIMMTMSVILMTIISRLGRERLTTRCTAKRLLRRVSVEVSDETPATREDTTTHRTNRLDRREDRRILLQQVLQLCLTASIQVLHVNHLEQQHQMLDRFFVNSIIIYIYI